MPMSSAFEPVSVTPWSSSRWTYGGQARQATHHARLGVTLQARYVWSEPANAPRPHGRDTGKPRAPRPSRFSGGADVFEPVSCWRRATDGGLHPIGVVSLGETRQRRRPSPQRP